MNETHTIGEMTCVFVDRGSYSVDRTDLGSGVEPKPILFDFFESILSLF